MITVWHILQGIIGFNLVLPLFLFMLNKFKGNRKSERTSQNAKSYDYAVIVTAYQETAHIPATVQSILNSDYENYLIYVVLDNCKDISGLHFNDSRVILLQPPVVLAGNVKSHFFAIDNFRREHDLVTIVDSDNLVDSNFFKEINAYFDEGYEAVQGVREAKNLDSPVACLDAARDIYYHFYDGHILFSLGSSATLSGSGMAFTTKLYVKSLRGSNIEGAGFDKVLQYQIVKRDIRIAFAGAAIVFDQKTSNNKQLVNQRARWINTWFKYFKFGFNLIGRAIKNGSANQLLFGLILLRPPLFLFLVMGALFFLTSIFIQPVVAMLWLIGFLLFISGFAVALGSSRVDKRIVNSLKHIPVFMYYQIVSLFKSGKANKRSVATRHFEQD